jgi:O-antigen/teichoic acid export membrane protein
MVKPIVVVSLLAAAMNLALNLALIPTFGPIGAGIGTCVTFLVHNALKQGALARHTSIPFFDRRYLVPYGTIVGVTGGLVVVAALTHPPLVLCIVLGAAASALVLHVSRDAMHLADTFPELQRLPVLRRII